MGEFKIRRHPVTGNYYWVELDDDSNVLKSGDPVHGKLGSALEDAWTNGGIPEGHGALEYEGGVVNG